MKTILIQCILLVSSTLCLVCSAFDRAEAAVVTMEEAGILIQSTATDVDFGTLAEFIAISPVLGSANYESTFSDPLLTWLGTLNGPYAGTPLGLSYLFDLSKFDSLGLVSWASTGTFGSDSLIGGGSATFQDTGFDQFKINYSSALSLAGNSELVTSELIGSRLSDGTIEILGNVPGGAGKGKLGAKLNPPKRIPPDFTYDRILDSVYVTNKGNTMCNYTAIVTYPNSPGVRPSFKSVTAVCPEPASFAIFGILASTVLVRFRKKAFRP